MQQQPEDWLKADFELGYTYTRSPGPLIGRFLAALKQQRLFGRRLADGTVLFPPTEYDPRNSEASGDWVEVEPLGTLCHWTWVAQPRSHHPRQQPFAFGLVRLDGADTPFLHVIDADSPARLQRGQRLRLVWSDNRRGAITDIAGFVPLAEC